MDPRPLEGGLTVTLDGVLDRRLGPGCRLTFGRAAGGPTHLQLAPADRCVSRVTGVVRWRGGQWKVRNRSRTLPFDVAVGNAVISLKPRQSWPVGPGSVVVRLTTPTSAHEVGLHPEPSADSDPDFPVGPGLTTVPPLDRRPSAHERELLGAKFLSRRQYGDAIGNRLAARRVTAVRRSPVTHKAVENCVRRWRDHLVAAGARDVNGPSKIDRVGRLLLNYGVLHPDDRLSLPPVDD